MANVEVYDVVTSSVLDNACDMTIVMTDSFQDTHYLDAPKHLFHTGLRSTTSTYTETLI